MNWEAKELSSRLLRGTLGSMTRPAWISEADLWTLQAAYSLATATSSLASGTGALLGPIRSASSVEHKRSNMRRAHLYYSSVLALLFLASSFVEAVNKKPRFWSTGA